MKKKSSHKDVLARAKGLGYVTGEELHQKWMRDKKYRELWEAGALNREVRSAIIRKRIEKKLTQAAVAKLAKMKQSAVARFETGEESPTLTTAGRILAAVGAKIKIS